MIGAKESPEKRQYTYKLNMQHIHAGIVKGNRVRVNVHR